MKIAIDASRYIHQKATGVEWYSWNIINGLLKLLPEEDVVLYAREEIEGKKVKVIERKRFWSLIGLSRALKKDQPDVLFVPSHVLPFNLPQRSVVTIHDVAFKHLRKSYGWKQYAYLNWSTRRAVDKANLIIVPSEATAEDLRNFYQCSDKKIKVIPHGPNKLAEADEKLFQSSPILRHFGISPKMKYFLYVGRLETKKNLIRLLESYAKFPDPEFKLVLAGKRGHGFMEILKKANELSLADRVIMPGYVTEEEKSLLLNHCQAFVFPSLYEGFGLPILEAFSYAKPVLTSNISSMPEVGGEAATYVNPLDVDSISEGLEKVLEMDAELGKKQLEKFSWEKAAKETLAAILGNPPLSQ